MKRTLYTLAILIAFLSFSSNVFAQGHFGVKGGVNLSNLDVKDVGKGDNLIGFQAGVVYYSNLEKALYFQTGLLYNTKGLKETEAGETGKFIYEFVEIPLNVGYKIPVGESFSISPFVGAFAGYALKAKLKAGGTTINLFDKDLLGESDPKRFDFGANIGVGLHISNRIIVSGQYSHGLADLNDVKTRAATLGLTFLF